MLLTLGIKRVKKKKSLSDWLYPVHISRVHSAKHSLYPALISTIFCLQIKSIGICAIFFDMAQVHIFFAPPHATPSLIFTYSRHPMHHLPLYLHIREIQPCAILGHAKKGANAQLTVITVSCWPFLMDWIEHVCRNTFLNSVSHGFLYSIKV